MGTFKFSIHMLKKESKKSMIYTLTLSLTIAVTFLFYNIIDNQYLLDASQIGKGIQVTDIPFSSILAFIVIMFCAFMIMFANNFYLSRKLKEIAIMTMSGSGYMSVTMYLFYQNIIMVIIAFPIGLFIGAIGSILSNQLIYQFLDHSAPFFYVPVESIGNTIICISVIIGAQFIYAAGFVHRKDITFMLSQEASPVLEDNRIMKLSPNLYVVIYILGVLGLIMMEYTPSSILVFSSVGVLGIGGMIKYIFPKFFKKIKMKRYLNDKLKLISISNLYYSLSRSIMLIGLFALSTTAMIIIIILQKDNPREFITAIIGFVVIIFLLLVSIVYKYILEASTRKTFYYNLYKLGYSYHQLSRIIQQEVSLFYMTMVGLPFIYIFISLVQAIIHNDVTIIFALCMMGIELVPIIIAGLITYRMYKKAVLLVIEEGIKYE